MGINAELIELVGELRQSGALTGRTVMEFGAEVVCCLPEVVDRVIARRFPADAGSGGVVPSAANMYARLGFDDYSSIDASGEHGALVLDLNSDLLAGGFTQQFDLVTNLVVRSQRLVPKRWVNRPIKSMARGAFPTGPTGWDPPLGTPEHCFNQQAGFKNIHDLCKPGGVMIHQLPSAGNHNHGFYNYHPRFVADLCAANRYEVLKIGFTVDYRPEWHDYSMAAFRRYDSHDVVIYAVLRRTSDSAFVTPFDGMFTRMNQLPGYVATGENPLETEFAPYLKTGDWANVRGDAPPPVAEPAPAPSYWRRLLGR